MYRSCTPRLRGEVICPARRQKHHDSNQGLLYSKAHVLALWPPRLWPWYLERQQCRRVHQAVRLKHRVDFSISFSFICFVSSFWALSSSPCGALCLLPSSLLPSSFFGIGAAFILHKNQTHRKAQIAWPCSHLHSHYLPLFLSLFIFANTKK